MHRPIKETEQALRIQLFEVKKKDKKYEEATKVFQDAMACDKSRRTSDEMLKLMTSFADMQVSQGNCGEAEDTIDDVLRWQDLPHGLEKQCYGIRGKILCVRKRYNEAEKLYRKLYDRASKDEWSLEMGDEMCNVIALQGDYDLARLEQMSLLEKRKKNLGIAHPSTVKSATTAVENIRKLVQKMPKENGPTGDRTWKRKQALDAEIEYILRDIWMSMAGNPQRQETNVLKVGHDLGASLSNQGKFDEAERVFVEVWHGRKNKLGEFNKDTMSSGISLGEAMYRQELRLSEAMYQSEKCRIARGIFEHIGASGMAQAYGGDDSIAMAARAHLGVLFAFLRAYDMAERLLRSVGWFNNNALAGGSVAMPPPDLMHFALTRCHESQGGVTKIQAQQLQLEPSSYGQISQPRASEPLMRDRRLAGTSSPWTGTTSGRLAVASSPYNTQSDFPSMTSRGGIEFYSAGMLDGKRLLQSRDLERAKMVLGQTWKRKTDIFEEAVARARCGDQYGLCLTELRQYEKARQVLEEVQALKKKLYPGPANQERIDTGNLKRAIPDFGRYGRRLSGKTARHSDYPSVLRTMFT